MIVFALDATKLNVLALMFASYATIVPFWDLCVYKLTGSVRSVIILCLGAIRFIIGIFMLIVMAIVALFQPAGSSSLHRNFVTCSVFLYVIVKFLRYATYAAGSREGE
jgi:hypothetical protein